MNLPNHVRAKQVFLQAVALAPAEREAYLAGSCQDDPGLRAEVESLLKYHDSQTILPQETEVLPKAAEGTSPEAHEGQPPGTLLAERPPIMIGGSLFAGLFGQRRRRWLAIVLAGLFLVAGELLVYRLVESAMQQQLEQELSTILAADLEALRIWFRLQEATAQSTAADPKVRESCEQLVKLAASAENLSASLLGSEDLAHLREELAPLLTAYGYREFVVIDRERRIIAASRNAPIGDDQLARGADELQVVFGPAPRAVVVLPYPSLVPLIDIDQQERSGVATMFAVAPLYNQAHEVMAALGLRIQPDQDFTRILNVAQAGATGETYAFDRQGILLSESRFGEQLKEIGLLPDRPEARSLLHVELRDPGVDLTQGGRAVRRRSEQPLTRMAQEATAGRSGVDTTGYRDYRGVPVVGAWVWLDDIELGVATEIDTREAFAPLRYLQVTSATIMLVLGVTMAVFLYSSFSVVSLREQVATMRRVGPYRLDRQIGEGGMAQVFLAHHDLLKRPTAVKLLKPELTSARDLARFEREVQAASQLTHPNTIEIYDFGRTPTGSFYYAMEYLPGYTLDQLNRQFGPLPVNRSVYILRQVCRSLREAHDRGLIHRDIKPQNIMLTDRGGECDFVKVVDFGLAKEFRERPAQQLTQKMMIQGTPLYIAPEILQGRQPPDPRVDVYSVGIVAYQLLAGRDPFEASSIVALFQQALQRTPPPLTHAGSPAIPGVVEELVLSCLAKDPAERPGSMESILAVLDSDLGIPPWTATDARQWWQQHGPPASP